ncbi:MAG: hypothetical protein JO125_07370 [Chloroflexi bacterium]|nr:hypothetical protein [Ktedonobacteraceae bacterium]MBV8822734.1 hypothetical protein [Ktedonobacteraceae bacterium]MBV9021320.1 hypothetical protein [Ktedonobacteraceae bacterium]MBV9707213.1 hypothetical protein [Chloroflexota bacterium]
MSSNYASGSDNAVSNNSSSFVSRREVRASNATGALPAITAPQTVEHGYTGGFDFGCLIQSLRELFAQDRHIASQPDSTRCGICYLHFCVGELYYREEGFYICPGCERSLGKHTISMLRRQQKL